MVDVTSINVGAFDNTQKRQQVFQWLTTLKPTCLKKIKYVQRNKSGWKCIISGKYSNKGGIRILVHQTFNIEKENRKNLIDEKNQLNLKIDEKKQNW